jgi:hypothetical protein
MAQTTARVPLLVRARFFGGLADPARLALLEELRHGESNAGDLAAAAILSPSNASKHLACLPAAAPSTHVNRVSYEHAPVSGFTRRCVL